MDIDSRKRTLVFVLGAAFVILTGSCAKSSNPTASSSTPTNSQSTSGGGGRYGGGGGATTLAPNTIQQGAGGFRFSPSTLTVKTGTTVTVTNAGTASHTFTITGKGIDVVNSSGQSQQVTIGLAPGTYQFICRFHVQFGMKGTLTVTA